MSKDFGDLLNQNSQRSSLFLNEPWRLDKLSANFLAQPAIYLKRYDSPLGRIRQVTQGEQMAYFMTVAQVIGQEQLPH